jgi:hypothetical protein
MDRLTPHPPLLDAQVVGDTDRFFSRNGWVRQDAKPSQETNQHVRHPRLSAVGDRMATFAAEFALRAKSVEKFGLGPDLDLGRWEIAPVTVESGL